MTTNELATMSAGEAPSEPAAPARLFVVCGRGCSSEELASLFGEFGVVSEVRCVPDKGVAYVQFSRDAPFAASRAIESVGANDDGEIEGGVASCRKFLGGCERTLRESCWLMTTTRVRRLCFQEMHLCRFRLVRHQQNLKTSS